MLGSNYMTINSIAIPNPQGGIKIAYQNIEKTSQSEAGQDLAIVTRLKKRTFSFTVKCNSTWKSQFETICGMTQTNLVFNSETIAVRARIDSASLEKFSEYAQNTDGLWTLGIKLIEV